MSDERDPLFFEFCVLGVELKRLEEHESDCWWRAQGDLDEYHFEMCMLEGWINHEGRIPE